MALDQLGILLDPAAYVELTTPEGFAVLLKVIGIDIVLAGDNAVVIALAVSALAASQRAKAMWLGIAAAVIMRLGFALIATQLLALKGLLFVGGLLLLWVAYKMYKQLRAGNNAHKHIQAKTSLWAAATTILVADVSMSLDNVLAVSGAAHENLPALVIGLLFSVVLMAIGATLIGKLLERYKWIGWAGFALIAYIALELLWKGWPDISLLMQQATIFQNAA